MRNKWVAAAMLAIAGLAVSGCRYDRPGHDSDRHGHHHGHDRDHGDHRR